MSTAFAIKTERNLESEVFGSTLEEVPALERAESLAHENGATAIRDSFDVLADELEEVAAGLSSTRRALRYPAFVEILALGDSVIPQVVDRLKTSENRPLWLRLLGTFTSSPPGLGKATVDEAAEAWIQWGRFAS